MKRLMKWNLNGAFFMLMGIVIFLNGMNITSNQIIDSKFGRLDFGIYHEWVGIGVMFFGAFAILISFRSKQV